MEGRIAAKDVAMFYLLAIAVSALRWGCRPAAVATIAGALSCDYFLPHRFMSLPTLFSMIVVGFLISALAGEARERTEVARRNREVTAAIYAFSQSLAGLSDIDGIVETAGRQIAESLRWPTLIALPGNSGLADGFRSAEFPRDPSERAAAMWALQHEETSGQGTRNVPLAKGHFVPLKTPWGVRGVLGVVAPPHIRAGDRQRLLEVFATRTALALGRTMAEETRRQTELLRETEKMQTAMLHSISHNLRTPLAAITGALETLLQDSAVLDEAARTELLSNAEEQAVRLNRLVGNLLDMTRLQAGVVHVKRQVCDIQDVVGAALDQLGPTARKRQIALALPPRQLLVALDFALMSQVIVNLVDNALKYSAPDQPVEIRVRAVNEEIEIAVLDCGIGIAEQDLELVFDRFCRGRRAAPGGTGLGLSICRGFVEAHGGRIWAERRIPAGTIVALTIPLTPERNATGESEYERAGTASARR